ncbi:MAG: hypothetical protein ACI4QA_06360 [Candidatus Spyradosoma sp.]
MNTQNIKKASTNTIKLAAVLGFLSCMVLASAEAEAAIFESVSIDSSVNFALARLSMKSYRKMLDKETHRIERYMPPKPFTPPHKVPGPKPSKWWR